MKKEEMKTDIENYTMSSLWVTMSSYLVLLFVKEFLTKHYLINFSIDLLVAVFAFYIALFQLKNDYKLLKKYQLSNKALLIQIITIIISFVIVLITLKSPFDAIFLILIIGYFLSKRSFKQEIMKKKS